MTKYTTINHESFETIKSSKTKDMIKRHIDNFESCDLFAYYENPSVIKQRIYDEWYDWYLDCYNVGYFEVTSANTFNFTFGAIYYDENTEEIIGYIQITKCHNKLYLIK